MSKFLLMCVDIGAALMALHFDYKARALCQFHSTSCNQRKGGMDPELGEVTEEEGDAIDVRAAVAEQRRRRRRRRQMARRAAEEELEAEFNRRLAREVMDTCNSNELELLFPEGRGRNHIQIISWARARAATAPHPSTRAKWRHFFDRYD